MNQDDKFASAQRWWAWTREHDLIVTMKRVTPDIQVTCASRPTTQDETNAYGLLEIVHHVEQSAGWGVTA